ncbi:MAG: hypothetical protein ABL895_04005 [Cyclobacteriaceae bacterium]
MERCQAMPEHKCKNKSDRSEVSQQEFLFVFALFTLARSLFTGARSRLIRLRSLFILARSLAFVGVARGKADSRTNKRDAPHFLFN